MERDFMGLNSKEPLASVKQEVTDEGSETHWSFMRSASSHPHFMSFKAGASQGDGMKKVVSDPISSSAFIASSTADAFDHGRKTSVGEIQNSPPSLSHPFLKPNSTSYGQNPAGATLRQQFLGIPMTVTSPVGPVVGFTDPWNKNIKNSLGGPAQMTIFYAGTVSVFDEITPEKAQAIMLLAGNGSSLASNLPPARSQVSSPVTKVAPVDAVVSNQPPSSQPGPDIRNQLSVSSHPIVQSSKAEQVMTMSTGVSSAPVSKPEPQRVVASRAPMPVPVMAPSAVPQFRKASLARFLEKRKERITSAAPYSCDQKPQEGITPGNNNSGSTSASATNSVSSSSQAVRGS